MRLASLPLAAALLAGFGTGTASATVIDISPTMRLEVSSVTNGMKVCATGAATSTVSQWVFTITGERSDGSHINESGTSLAASFSQCRTIPKNGAVTGHFTATLNYAGAASDLIGHANRTGGWAPVIGDFNIGDGG